MTQSGPPAIVAPSGNTLQIEQMSLDVLRIYRVTQPEISALGKGSAREQILLGSGSLLAGALLSAVFGALTGWGSMSPSLRGIYTALLLALAIGTAIVGPLWWVEHREQTRLLLALEKRSSTRHTVTLPP